MLRKSLLKSALGGRINMVTQAAFFKLTEIIPVDDAIKYLKESVVTSYGKKVKTSLT